MIDRQRQKDRQRQTNTYRDRQIQTETDRQTVKADRAERGREKEQTKKKRGKIDGAKKS